MLKTLVPPLEAKARPSSICARAAAGRVGRVLSSECFVHARVYLLQKWRSWECCEEVGQALYGMMEYP